MFKCLLLYSELKLTARGHSALRDGTYTTLIRKVDKSSIIRQIIDLIEYPSPLQSVKNPDNDGFVWGLNWKLICRVKTYVRTYVRVYGYCI